MIYDFVNQWGERRMLRPLREHFTGRAAGQVLEIGAGTGANFRVYPPAARVVATEPNPYMLRRARKREAVGAGNIELIQCAAEALLFADASFGMVVATMVFCTVVDLARSLIEVRRVLTPVGSADGILGQAQDVFTCIQRRITAGCHLNRRTAEAIEAAGFAILELRQCHLPLTPLIFGVARSSERSTP